MVTFFICIAALILGYFVYGKFVERKFGADPERTTPAIAQEDGVDFVPMNWKRIFLIQFLNIAGLGPIFGAIAGALWGPVAFIWIVFGCIFAGAVHDYFSGMLSMRHGGASIPEVVGKYLGPAFKNFMRVFSVILLILVGVVFIKGPASILNGLTGFNVSILIGAIFLYYLIATMVPIDKLIGKVYPFFGLCLLVMAFGIAGALLLGDFHIPELIPANIVNLHASPSKYPIYPLLFITIACGAISGFHSTQSPLMARCITNEKQGRKIFYGTMIAEGIVAMIWAAAAMTFFGGVRELGDSMSVTGHNAAWVVNEICNSLLGKIGGFLAIFGVVAAPITSGDTAFRSARLTIADSLNFSQKSISKRLLITIPLFLVGFLLTQVNFAIIWRYFGWANQTLATVVLWTAAMYMVTKGRSHWFISLPATFMTAVITTYIIIAPEGFGLSQHIAYPIGIFTALLSLGVFLYVAYKKYSPSLKTATSIK
ncbi:carbon starvation protein A [Labilibaculum sp.]|uniref:carbon starvation CstA family protein n=1 Tax=Labilibaculum sp. TaxID=2060723 RepID=UPI003568F0D5